MRKTNVLMEYVEVLGEAKASKLKEWEQGYIAACSDGSTDRVAMLAAFARRAGVTIPVARTSSELPDEHLESKVVHLD